MDGIDLDREVSYRHASMRYFHPGEHHIRRYCSDDVLLLVFRGTLRFSEDGEAYEAGSGEYHIQKHGTIQDGILESTVPEYLYVHFYADWGEGRNCLPKRGRFQVSELFPYMEQLHDTACRETSLMEKSGLFYQILTLLHHQSIRQDPRSILIQEILNELLNSLKDPPSLDYLAEQYHFSKNHIIHMIREYCGKTPYQYLGELRLKKAVWLLETSALSIEEIACECGYSDYSHFYKAFKKQFQYPPGRWRDRKNLRSFG